MYRFVDTTPQGSPESTSLSIQTIFNGVNLDEALTDNTGHFITLSVTGRSNTVKRINTIPINGMDGVHELEETTMDVREPVITFKIKDETSEGFRNRLNRLNAFLEGSQRQLLFTDENMTYYATLQTLEIPEENSNDLVGTITFLCSDPFKYGDETFVEFNSDAFSFDVKGNESTPPIVDLEVLQPITFLDIFHETSQEYMRIGEVINIEEETYNPKELVFSNRGSTTVGWSVASEIDDGTITGSIQGTPEGFMIDAIGTELTPRQWQGPSIKQSLTRQVQDFQLDVYVDLINREKDGTGMIEVYLLDVDNNVVAKIGIEDVWKGFAQNRTKFQLGDIDLGNRYTRYTLADWKPGWNNFRGIIRLTRKGQLIQPYYSLIDENGRHYWSSSQWKYLDTEEIYQTPIAQIQIAMRSYGGTFRDTMRIRNIHLWELNEQPTEEAVPYMANVGDHITIDHKNEEILINGENRNELKDFGGTYFDLFTGRNEFYIFPNESVNGTIRWRAKYK